MPEDHTREYINIIRISIFKYASVVQNFFFLKKRNKKRALPSHPKIGDLNFLNAEEKTPSRLRLGNALQALAPFHYAPTT